MKHGLRACTSLAKRGEIADVAYHDFVIALSLKRLSIEKSQGKMFSQQRNDVCSDAPSGSGDQNAFALHGPKGAAQRTHRKQKSFFTGARSSLRPGRPPFCEPRAPV